MPHPSDYCFFRTLFDWNHRSARNRSAANGDGMNGDSFGHFPLQLFVFGCEGKDGADLKAKFFLILRLLLVPALTGIL